MLPHAGKTALALPRTRNVEGLVTFDPGQIGTTSTPCSGLHVCLIRSDECLGPMHILERTSFCSSERRSFVDCFLKFLIKMYFPSNSNASFVVETFGCKAVSFKTGHQYSNSYYGELLLIAKHHIC